MALEKLIKVTTTTHLKITHMYNSEPHPSGANELTHWGWVRHIWVSKLTTIYSDNGLSPGRHQANIWTNAGILWIEPLGTNFTEISIKIYTFSFKKIHLKMLSGKWLPFCFSLNVLVFSTYTSSASTPDISNPSLNQPDDGSLDWVWHLSPRKAQYGRCQARTLSDASSLQPTW